MGWKPLRTIVLASWDAEEYGLIGSTEWTEDFASFLVSDAAAYINIDSSVTAGSIFSASASPSLAWLYRGAAQDVPSGADPSLTVWDSRSDGGDWKEWRLNALGIEEEDFEELALSGTGVSPLGSGSDFTSFLQRYGVASGNIGFDGGPKSAVYHYHSIYDSFAWQDKFSDPGFHTHVDAAKILGLILLRLSDSLVLPINTTQYANDLLYYLSKVEHIAESLNVAFELNFTSLSTSIKSLVETSESLDVLKNNAIEELRKLLPKAKDPKHGVLGCIRRAIWKVRAKCGSKKGEEKLRQMELWRDPGVESQLTDKKHHSKPSPPMKKIKEIKKVLLEIRGINKKLKGFEGGFISEEGIKVRGKTLRRWEC